MNVLHVIPYFAPAWAFGGPPRSVYELCCEQVRSGHRVTVATTDASGERPRLGNHEEALEGMDVHRFPNASNWLAWRHHLFLPTGFGPFLRRHLSEFDVIHLHMYRTIQNILVRRYATNQSVPYVFSARGSLPRIVRRETTKAVFDIAYGKRVLRDASRHIASSRIERKHYEAMGVPTARIAVIPNGVDARQYERLPPPGTFARQFGLEGKTLVTYMGRLNARKGLEVLVDAFHRLARTRDDVALVLAGPDDGYRRTLELLVRRLAIAERTILPGLLTGAQRLGAFVDSRVVVYPTSYEPFGLVPFEALLCGTPVIVAEESGCGELIRDTDAGFTVPYGDVSALENALGQVLDGGDSVRESVRNGRRLVQEELNWTRIARQVVDLYRQVAS